MKAPLGLMLTVLLTLTACQRDDDGNAGPAPSRGEADFTRYVAVGNSLTAGFSDGGLYRSAQLTSYPNLLAEQFRQAGGGEFIQPLFSAEQANGTGYQRLSRIPQSAIELLTSVVAVPAQAVRGQAAPGRPLFTKFTGQSNNNLGVPGIRMADVLTPGYGSAQGNPYFERLLPDNSPKTYLDYVSDNLAGATFFTCWMGNNDVLAYALSGGASPPTPTALFTTNNTALINKLTENDRKGVVIGIPNMTAAPFFTTVTIPVVLSTINLTRPGQPPLQNLIVQTAAGPRASRSGDLLLLTGAGDYARIGSTSAGTGQGPYGLSPANPLPTQLVLDADEAAAVVAKVNELNAVLKQQADAKGLAFVDPNGILTQLAQSGGLTSDGVTYNLSYIQGGVISLDGIHLTPAGYALVANEIIRAINAKYKSTLPLLDTSRYRRVYIQAS